MTKNAPAARTTLTVDRYTGDSELLWQVFYERWLSGKLGYMRSANVYPARLDARWLLPGGEVVLRYQRGRTVQVLQQDPGGAWVLYAARGRSRSHCDLDFKVAARTKALADALIKKLTSGAKFIVPVPPPPPIAIDVSFWFMRPDGPSRFTRTLEVRPWEKIKPNYTASVQAATSKLMGLRPKQIAGKIILMHGEPGSGKTTLLRALGWEWRSWCDVTFIVDPEKMLNDGTYLIRVLTENRGNGDNRWHLVIMEDSGELFTADAKERSGQGLARLLNAADGILGQGFKVLFALTTNEHHDHLHEAMTRPGRALANISVPPLTAAEATTWLGDGEISEPKTLAQLFALKNPGGTADVITNVGIPVTEVPAIEALPKRRYMSE